MPYVGAVEVPVPPRAIERKPVKYGAKVCTSPAEVMVRPMFASDEVAKVCVEPVCADEY